MVVVQLSESSSSVCPHFLFTLKCLHTLDTLKCVITTASRHCVFPAAESSRLRSECANQPVRQRRPFQQDVTAAVGPLPHSQEESRCDENELQLDKRTLSLNLLYSAALMSFSDDFFTLNSDDTNVNKAVDANARRLVDDTFPEFHCPGRILQDSPSTD